jgi:hypothetical protein
MSKWIDKIGGLGNIDGELVPFTPKPKKRNLESLTNITLGEQPESDETKPEEIIGTLVNNKGEIVSVQDPNRPLKNLKRKKD